jgi:hypothetical protein
MMAGAARGPEACRELREERVLIMEINGGLSPDEAGHQAFLIIKEN